MANEVGTYALNWALHKAGIDPALVVAGTIRYVDGFILWQEGGRHAQEPNRFYRALPLDEAGEELRTLIGEVSNAVGE